MHMHNSCAYCVILSYLSACNLMITLQSCNVTCCHTQATLTVAQLKKMNKLMSFTGECHCFQMKMTYDDQHLITISEDSCVMIWKVQDREGRNLKRDKEISHAEEILITKSDLEEKVFDFILTRKPK